MVKHEGIFSIVKAGKKNVMGYLLFVIRDWVMGTRYWVLEIYELVLPVPAVCGELKIEK